MVDNEGMNAEPSILSRGLLAGGVAGACVLAVFTAYDVFTAELFRTPSVLHAHFFEGLEAAMSVEPHPGRAALYTLVHFAVWIGAGVVAAHAVAFRPIFPGLWSALVIGPALLFGVFLWVAGVWGIPGLGVHHFWVGALLGGAAMAVFLLRGHQALDLDGATEG